MAIHFLTVWLILSVTQAYNRKDVHMKIEHFGEVSNVDLYLRSYENGNLALFLMDTENGPWGTVTVNVGKCDRWESALDTNNIPEVEEFIKKYKLGEPTNKTRVSGYCIYPVYKFYPEAIKKYAVNLGSKEAEEYLREE